MAARGARRTGGNWFQRMSRSEQVIAGVVAALVTGLFAASVPLVNKLINDSPASSGKPEMGPVNVINNSTVNQYFEGGPRLEPSNSSKSGSSSSCTATTPKQGGAATVFVRIEAKAQDTPCWTQYLAPVSPGATIRYLITYQNISQSVQHDVVLRVSLSPKITLVPNSTSFANSNYPKGKLATSNDIINGGLIIGNYGPGANAFLVLTVAIPFAQDLACDWNDFRVVGVVHPRDMNEFYNTVDLEVGKAC